MKQSIKKSGIPFTQISNELFKSNLSLKAIGLYTFMYSKPDHWNFTIRSMSKQVKDGIDGIRTAMNELKKSNWISYTKYADGSGQYILFISPKLDIPIERNPKLENPKLEKPNVGKSNSISNTYLSSNKDYNNKSIKSFKNWNEEEFKQEIINASIEIVKDGKYKFANQSLIDFLEYWTEPSASGKYLFQLKPTWSTKRRLQNWLRNNFNNTTVNNSKFNNR